MDGCVTQTRNRTVLGQPSPLQNMGPIFQKHREGSKTELFAKSPLLARSAH